MVDYGKDDKSFTGNYQSTYFQPIYRNGYTAFSSWQYWQGSKNGGGRMRKCKACKKILSDRTEGKGWWYCDICSTFLEKIGGVFIYTGPKKKKINEVDPGKAIDLVDIFNSNFI